MDVAESVLIAGWIAFQIIAALAFTDFMSGVLHWLQDRYIHRHWPGLGPAVVDPSIIHHIHARAFVESGFWPRNMASLVVGGLLLVLFWATGALTWFTTTFALASIILPTETHVWAHRTERENGPAVAWLQRRGIVQSFAHHRQHHSGREITHYCAMSNFVNPVLERINFWRGCEAVIFELTGARPKPHPAVQVTATPDPFIRSVRPTAARRLRARWRVASRRARSAGHA